MPARPQRRTPPSPTARSYALYAAALAEAHDDPAAALIVTLDLAPAWTARRSGRRTRRCGCSRARPSPTAPSTPTRPTARSARRCSAALDAPDSPLARALVADVRARTGLALPAEAVLRHARLVLRGPSRP